MSTDDMVELHRLTQEQMTTVAHGPFVTFMVACPSCGAKVPLPTVVMTPELEKTLGSNRLTMRLTEIASVEHTCTREVDRG